MSDIIFEAQTALFSALEGNTSFMTAVNNNIFDTPGDNQAYPYVCLEDTNDTPLNTHDKLGKNAYFTFGIYTKPDPLNGTYKSKDIRGIMNSILDMKKFSLESTSFSMAICVYDGSTSLKKGDVRSILAVYKCVLFDNT